MNSKRTIEDSSVERTRKMPFKRVTMVGETLEEMEFKFRVLLPNSTTIELKMSELQDEIPMEDFIELVKKEYDRGANQRKSPKSDRIINWENKELYFTDEQSKEIRSKVKLCDFMHNKWHFLWLHDGSAKTEVYEGVWDLNEDPADNYTIETALANSTDSLQTMRLNGEGERQLISVELLPNRTSITDSGPSRDGVDGNNCMPVDDCGQKLEDHNQEVPSVDCQEPEIEGAFPTLRTPKLELEDDLPSTSSTIIRQKESEDDLLSSAMTMTDHNRELKRLQFIQLHIQQEIQDLQVKPRPLFENTSWNSQLLTEKESELVIVNKLVEEENEAYRRATEKFLMARDKYNNLSQIGSDIPIDEGRLR